MLLARFGVTVGEMALFLSVWIIYLFDRLYDTRKPKGGARSTLRHRFASRHRPLLLLLFSLACILLLALLPQLRRPDWILGLCAGSGVLVYFVLFRFHRGETAAFLLRGFPGKEFSIAFFFTLGVLGAAGVFEKRDEGVSLLLLTTCGTAFLLLVVTNCLVIAAAEREIDRVHDSASFSSTNPGTPFPTGIPFLALTIPLIPIFRGVRLADTFLPGAILLAAASLVGLHQAAIPSRYRQPLSDAVMLVPWIFVLFGR